MKLNTTGKIIAAMVVMSMVATGVTAAAATPNSDVESDMAVNVDDPSSEFGNVAVGVACSQADSTRAQIACSTLLGTAGVSKYAMLAGLAGGPYGYAAAILISL